MRDIAAFIHSKRELLLFFVLALLLEGLACLFANTLCATLFYVMGMQTFLLSFMLLISFARFMRKKKALSDLQGAVFNKEAALPAPDTALEEMYGTLLGIARREHDAIVRRSELAQKESLSYYTLWVHQIKTPIAAMHLMIGNEEGSAALRQELFRVERYADLALQYVRIGDIANDLCVEKCDLQAVVHAVVKKYAVMFVYKKLSVTIDEMPERVLTDKKWLMFILEQIISNAVKYTTQGGVHIYFANGALMVSDTGVGIRFEDVPRVFEKGYTGYNGRVDSRASGIGMYLTKRVCDTLSISITLTSRLSQGTTVSLLFPGENPM